MNTRKVTYEYRLNQWIGIIRECRDSGQTVTSWCAEHNINAKSYYYWLRKIRTAACNALSSISSEGQIVPIDMQKVSTPTIIDSIQIPSGKTSADIVLHFDSVVLEINNNASASLIESIIRVLQNAR